MMNLKNARRMAGLLSVLVVGFFLIFLANSFDNESRDARGSGVAFFNEAVQKTEEGEIDRALSRYERVLSVAEPGSTLHAYARYNHAMLLAEHRWSLEEAPRILSLLRDALRESPGDRDVRKNLEILYARLVNDLVDLDNDSVAIIEEVLDPNSSLWPQGKHEPEPEEGDDEDSKQGPAPSAGDF
ncbi:hypothetical protein IID24_05690 [Patescibacteria group bacterium]|nr:hypothetical protein [Patescibacteria group bacterium]